MQEISYTVEVRSCTSVCQPCCEYHSHREQPRRFCGVVLSYSHRYEYYQFQYRHPGRECCYRRLHKRRLQLEHYSLQTRPTRLIGNRTSTDRKCREPKDE